MRPNHLILKTRIIKGSPSPIVVLAMLVTASLSGSTNLTMKETPFFPLNALGYFQNQGVGIMAYEDHHLESKQGGIIIVSHGNRIASNGDLRLESTPGQWAPTPKLLSRTIDHPENTVRVRLSYPDERQDRRGFNPILYPELELEYEVVISPSGDGVEVRVDLDHPIPAAWEGEIGFLLELYPPDLFGKSWLMDDATGIFPRQPSNVRVDPLQKPDPKIVQTDELKWLVPLSNHRARAEPMAIGQMLSIAPESDTMRLTIESCRGPLELLDGRTQHQNGWFVVRSAVPSGATKGAVRWIIRPHVIPDWISPPALQHSMAGYHPAQSKVAVIEMDPNDNEPGALQLIKLRADGNHEVVLDRKPSEWGHFLRYRYHHFDFSSIQAEGMYQIVMGELKSPPFPIAKDVYDRNVWQPTLDYFLPIQMGHMRVKEKYKLWHDTSHMDDALMAPVNINHFDGYVQGPSTLTRFQPGDHVPGLTRGGWFDAGDEDFRVESQAGEVFALSIAFDEFAVMRDNTLISQELRLVEIREPDGIPDILQQIEHGLLTVVGGYEALGRLYRGIIVPTLSQYVMGGDFSGQTDNLIYDPSLKPGERTATHSAIPDDRWVFTEENPTREWDTIANITASVPAMRGYNDTLAAATLNVAIELWEVERDIPNEWARIQRIRAAVELFRVTREARFQQVILEERDYILSNIEKVGWSVARVIHDLEAPEFLESMRQAVAVFDQTIQERMKQTPYHLDFQMQLWGRGWDLQKQGVCHYFLHKAFPETFGRDYLLNILHYVLGTNPGSNPQSYATGVGAKSKSAAYGFNRMDYSYIPGGVIVGTALVKPDFPELKAFPFLWQQSEYVLGGGASNFMFLTLAAHDLLNSEL